MRTLWIIFFLLLFLLLLTILVRCYTLKRLDSIDGVIGITRQKEIEQARNRIHEEEDNA